MTSPARAQGCGPGPHWIDDCDADVDNMPNTRALVGVDLDLDCLVDANLILSGPVTVDRSDPSDDSNRFPGLRPVDGHLDVIDTEILTMSLTGNGFILVAGAGQGQDEVLDHSYGAIAELPDDSLGESFFDVFFEIYIPPPFGDMYLYNHDSLRIATVIDRVPPFGATYIKPTGCLPLYTAGGVHVANLVEAEHNIPDIPTLSEWGMLLMGLLLLVVGTIAVVRRRTRLIRSDVT